MIIGTLIVSAGAHVSSNEPAIVLFGYLRHGLVGRGVELFGLLLLFLNFLDGLYKLSKLDWQRAAIVGGVCLCLLVGFIVVLTVRHHRKADPLVGLKPAVYQNTQTLSGEKLPLPPTKK